MEKIEFTTKSASYNEVRIGANGEVKFSGESDPINFSGVSSEGESVIEETLKGRVFDNIEIILDGKNIGVGTIPATGSTSDSVQA